MEPKRYTIPEIIRTYMTWTSMVQRCKNAGNSAWRDYGGRGIQVCERWLDFETFVEDMGPRPSDEYTIDRKDFNGNYEPDNCRWATATEQARNRSTSRFLTFRGETKPILEWVKYTGIPYRTIIARIDLLGWDIEQALTVSVGSTNKAHVTFAEGRAKGKKLTRAQVEEIVERAKKGEPASRIAMTFGVTGGSVCQILKRFGVPLKKGRPKC